jgi:anti-anti-sigma factor
MHVIRSPSPVAAAFSFTVVRVDPSRASLAASGELDLAAVQHLAALMAVQEDVGRRFIRLDLSAVTFMDCSCLGVLLEVHLRLQEQGGQLILTDISSQVARLLATTDPTSTLLTSTEPEHAWGGASA